MKISPQNCDAGCMYTRLEAWLWAVAFLYLNGMSITGGYHRLWAHNAYDAHPALRWFFAFWGAGALQNSILIWCSCNWMPTLICAMSG